MRIAVGADEHLQVVDDVVSHLRNAGHEVELVADEGPWPGVGRTVARAVVDGVADLGVVCCWTGTGVSIAANKVPGCRAALCTDAETARGARRWNDANVLAIGMRLTSGIVAGELLDAFLDASADPDELATIATVEPEPSTAT